MGIYIDFLADLSTFNREILDVELCSLFTERE